MLTRAEESNFQETSLHADVMRFIDQLKQRQDPRLEVTSFGTSPGERDLPLLILSAGDVKKPEQVRDSKLPVVLIINGIHPGEVEGKEASLMLARDILSSSKGDILKHMTLLIIPLLNPDGNDAIAENRILDVDNLEGQDGPKLVGTRENSHGINLNRDYMKQISPEMRLFQTKVCQKWQPHLTIDCHTTNGSVHRYAMTYDIPHTIASGRSEPILFMREQLLPVVTQRFNRHTGLDSFFYGNFLKDELKQEGSSGWITYPHHPRFGSNYRGLTNRMDLLLETYAYIDFHSRVFTMYKFLFEVLTFVSERGSDITQVVESSQKPPDQIAVQYRLEAFPEPVEILTREPHQHKLEGRHLKVTVPHFANFVGREPGIINRPWGYAVPEAVALHLQQHGLSVRQLTHDRQASVEVAYIESVIETSENRSILEPLPDGEILLQVDYQQKTRQLTEGTYLVETGQPLGAIAVYLCEAVSDDNIVACGIIPRPTPHVEFPVLRVLKQL